MLKKIARLLEMHLENDRRFVAVREAELAMAREKLPDELTYQRLLIRDLQDKSELSRAKEAVISLRERVSTLEAVAAASLKDR